MSHNIANTVRYILAKGQFTTKDMMDKGELLEREIFDILHNNVKGYKKVLVDLILPNGRGGTTQVDLVLIHSTGITVIESKNYNGTVIGTVDKKQWTIIYPNGSEYIMYNPIMQNAGHMRAVLEAVYGTQTPGRYVFCRSLVVFGRDTRLANGDIYDTVSGFRTLMSNVNVFEKGIKDLNNKTPCFNRKQIIDIYNKLKKYIRNDNKTKQDHIAYVNEVLSKQSVS